MEITVKSSDLVKELGLGQGVVEKKTTIPVLSNVLIEAQEGRLLIAATDLELGIQAFCPATVTKKGSTTLPAKKLLDYVRLLPDAELALKVGDNQAASIACGRAKTRIAGMSRDNFPELPKMPAALTKIPAKALVNSISKTIFAVANEESRYTLIGALMVLREDGIAMVATDGHRLAFVRTPMALEGVSGEIRGLIPKKAMAELQKLAADGGESMMVDFATDENHLFFQCGSRLLVTRKLSGQFPDYERVLPKEKGTAVPLHRDELMAAVRRVSQFADDRSRAVRFELAEGELKLAASGSDAGESEESIPAETGAKRMKVGFNAQYVLDFLGVAETDSVELQFKDEESAGQMQLIGQGDYEYRYVVMPMRI
ncbi:MAG: DNA polymerase III subunit beta [Acidobacteria bacterium]|nr:DNA polymerase III subunit beta [Acidobacteriota bacterium]